MQNTFRFTESTANGVGAPFQLGPDPGRFAREALITTETWNQFVDWNGDGRLDVIDVKGGQNSDKWKVWINEPSHNAALRWRPIQVDIAPVRSALAARGLRRDDYSDFFPDLDWSTRLPIERVRSWPRSETRVCKAQTCDQSGCREAGPCDTSDYEHVIGTDSITEWQIIDRNEDGFPDFAANDTPAKYCEKVIPEGNAPNCSGGPSDPGAALYCATKTQEWMKRTLEADCDDYSPEEGRARYVLNTAGPFVGLTGSPFSPLSNLEGWPELGDVVSHWTTDSRSTTLDFDGNYVDTGFSWQASGPRDRFDWGRQEANLSSEFGGEVASAFESTRHLCSGPNSGFISDQVLGESDFNGDGLADRINLVNGRSTVAFNTGAGYGPPHQLRWPTDTFAISESGGLCGGDAHTTAGLTDLDGDGKPELIRVKGGVLYMSRVVPGDGVGDLHSVGKLLQVGNQRGGFLRIVYGNVKREINTEHAVPFPEIAVRKTYSFTSDNSAPISAPTHYAYGGARLEYDPLAGC
ncbi:MAG TPA: VCBS repeat-containing protein [Gemmatimonadaceae bacterium]|nr:VCBS repeat-containing protein [Gemmatimonadaceae bacterium]